jgi:hypothetical protein
VVLIDPFVGRIPAGPTSADESPLPRIPFQLFDAYRNNARYKPSELALAADDGVYSRFLVAPDRGDPEARSDGRAIASGALGGFSGFLSEEFRRHDFFLGRRNCQRFLAEWFALPEGNHLFARWSAADRSRHRFDRKGVSHLPIVPLVDPVQEEQRLPTWPAGQFDLDAIMKVADQRLDSLYHRFTEALGPLDRLALGLAWRTTVHGRISRFVRSTILDGLATHRLVKRDG